MKKVEILDFNSLASFDELENVNTVTTIPLIFYSSTISYPTLSVKRALEPVELIVEPNNAGDEQTVDSLDNVGKAYINASNQLVFIVAKDKVMNACMAKEFIVGFIVTYMTGRVVYNTPANAATYNMIVERGCDGAFVSSYKQAALSDIIKTIPTLDNTLNVDMTGGYVYKIFRDLTNCNVK